jgi:hypothetical protein
MNYKDDKLINNRNIIQRKIYLLEKFIQENNYRSFAKYYQDINKLLAEKELYEKDRKIITENYRLVVKDIEEKILSERKEIRLFLDELHIMSRSPEESEKFWKYAEQVTTKLKSIFISKDELDESWVEYRRICNSFKNRLKDRRLRKKPKKNS